MHRASVRSKESGVDFDITVSDIEWVTHCPILGIKLERGGKIGNSPSLDRITPELGYIKGNVRVISQLANTMKSSATMAQLELFSENIMKYMRGEL